MKKHRKKTPYEHDDQAGKSIDEIIDMNIYSNNDNNNSNDDEEIGRPRGNTHGTEIIDKHNSLSWTSDDDDERGVTTTNNNKKQVQKKGTNEDKIWEGGVIKTEQ